MENTWTIILFTHFASWKLYLKKKSAELSAMQFSVCCVQSKQKKVQNKEHQSTCDVFTRRFMRVNQRSDSTCHTDANIVIWPLLRVKLVPTLWPSAALGLNREARCAPRMRVCRVPISEYTVIGLPEDPYLTFRFQVAGPFRARPLLCLSR